jgi:hypothetical protein
MRAIGKCYRQRPDLNASNAWAIRMPMLNTTKMPTIFVNMRSLVQGEIKGQACQHSQSKSRSEKNSGCAEGFWQHRSVDSERARNFSGCRFFTATL